MLRQAGLTFISFQSRHVRVSNAVARDYPIDHKILERENAHDGECDQKGSSVLKFDPGYLRMQSEAELEAIRRHRPTSSHQCQQSSHKSAQTADSENLPPADQ